MKVRYIGKEKMDYLVDDNDIDLIPGKIYEVLAIEPKTKKFYNLVDESGEDYIYPSVFFEVVEE